MSAKCLCCEQIYSLGCFDSCQMPIVTPLTAPSNDEFTFQLEFNGQIVRWSQEYLMGNPFEIPGEFVNADYQHVFKVFDSAGTQVTMEMDTVVYDCFSFTVIPNVGQTGFTFPGPEIQTPQ